MSKNLTKAQQRMLDEFRDAAERTILSHGGHYVTDASQISDAQNKAIEEMMKENEYHDIIADKDGLTIYCLDYEKGICVPYYPTQLLKTLN